MQELVHKLLTERGLTLATAESCTGGNIAARFTAMPGASAYFLCGVVSYSNASKHDIPGRRPGGHCPPRRRQRRGRTANGRRGTTDLGCRLRHSDHRYRRPAGGSAEKPVGTVWIAVATPHRTTAILKQCGSDRGQIIDRASAFAISLLRDELNGK